MKTYVSACLAMVCAAAIGLSAQRAQRPTTATTRYVAIGCISREAPAARGRGAAAPRFILTDTRSDPPTRYQLQGDASLLDVRVGHTVEVAGALSTAAGGRGGQSANPLILKVESLTWISTTCGRLRA